jgi:hypothetical protein
VIVLNKVGALVKELRGDMSQREFGLAIGSVPASVICDIELAKKEPSKAVAKKLASYSGKPIGAFLWEEDDHADNQANTQG